MAAPLLAGELEPARERALADPVGPRDLGPAALAGLVGRERPLAQVGGVGTRHRSPPVGVKTIPTADRGAGSVGGRAIRSRGPRTELKVGEGEGEADEAGVAARGRYAGRGRRPRRAGDVGFPDARDGAGPGVGRRPRGVGQAMAGRGRGGPGGGPPAWSRPGPTLSAAESIRRP